jgi:hypothetical protein
VSRRKPFGAGQPVDVQREPSAPWEPATYDKPQPGGPGHHLVVLPPGAPPRMIKMPVGEIEVRWLTVPSQRIRARKEKP